MARARKNLTVHVSGFEEINEAMRKLEERASGSALRNAASAGAEVIRAEAEARAPRDTGALAEGVTEQPKRLQIGRAQIDVGPGRDEWYGKLLEKGTSKMPAKPWLRPAFVAKREEAVAKVREVLRKALGL